MSLGWRVRRCIPRWRLRVASARRGRLRRRCQWTSEHPAGWGRRGCPSRRWGRSAGPRCGEPTRIAITRRWLLLRWQVAARRRFRLAREDEHRDEETDTVDRRPPTRTRWCSRGSVAAPCSRCPAVAGGVTRRRAGEQRAQQRGADRAADLLAVLTIAEATPASCRSTPSVASPNAGAKIRPMPRPMISSAGQDVRRRRSSAG